LDKLKEFAQRFDPHPLTPPLFKSLIVSGLFVDSRGEIELRLYNSRQINFEYEDQRNGHAIPTQTFLAFKYF